MTQSLIQLEQMKQLGFFFRICLLKIKSLKKFFIRFDFQVGAISVTKHKGIFEKLITVFLARLRYLAITSPISHRYQN